MNALAGLWPMCRLILRQQRWALAAWLGLLSLTAVGTGSKYRQLFNTPETIAGFSAELQGNPMLAAFGGELTSSSVAGLTLFKAGDMVYAMVGLMVMLLVMRHTRVEEESGRTELLAAGCMDRRTPLVAASLVAVGAAAAVGVLCALGWMALGFETLGCWVFAAAVLSMGIAFTAISALAAQLVQTGGGAKGLAGLVLALSYMLRFVADGTGTHWLKWLAPQGWSHLMQPFGANRWEPLLVSLVFSTAVFAVSLSMAGTRDLGSGMRPQRAGPARAHGLTTAFSLAWRLQRGLLAGWTCGFAVAGLVLGGMVGSMPDMVKRGGPAMQEFFKRYTENAGGNTADVFMWVLILSLGYTAALFPALSLLRLRDEESSGRAELLLSLGVGRLELAAGHLLCALGGTALLLTAGGLGIAASYGYSRMGQAQDWTRLLAASLVQVPAAWVLGGVVMLVLGVRPRMAAGAAWSGWLFMNLFGEVLGPVLGVDYWIADNAIPFHHLPKVLTGDTLRAAPLLALTGVTLLLVLVGLGALRRRDVVAS